MARLIEGDHLMKFDIVVANPPFSFDSEYKETKNQNVLTDEHVQKLVDTHRAFQSVEKYACRATQQEIADNDFNLNIPRYVDTFEEEAEIDLDAVKADITRLESELATVREKMQAHLEELGLS